MSKKYPQLTEQEKTYIQTHVTSAGIARCARHLQRSVNTVSKYVRKTGIIIPHRIGHQLEYEDRRTNPQRQNVDPRPFITDITPTTAYLLGLIWADGHIRRSSYTISLLMAVPNVEEVWKIIQTTGHWRRNVRKQRRVSWKETWAIRTNNYLLHRHLKNHGYLAKSWASADKILSTIPNHLKHYWFRGLVDGDGCFSVVKRASGVTKRRFSLCSGHDQDWSYLTQVLDALSIAYRIERTVRINKQTQHSNSYSKVHIETLGAMTKWGDYLYRGREQDGIGFTTKWANWKAIALYHANRPARTSRFSYICFSETRAKAKKWKADYGRDRQLGWFHTEEEAKAAQDMYADTHGLPRLGERPLR